MHLLVKNITEMIMQNFTFKNTFYNRDNFSALIPVTQKFSDE